MRIYINDTRKRGKMIARLLCILFDIGLLYFYFWLVLSFMGSFVFTWYGIPTVMLTIVFLGLLGTIVTSCVFQKE